MRAGPAYQDSVPKAQVVYMGIILLGGSSRTACVRVCVFRQRQVTVLAQGRLCHTRDGRRWGAEKRRGQETEVMGALPDFEGRQECWEAPCDRVPFMSRQQSARARWGDSELELHRRRVRLQNVSPVQTLVVADGRSKHDRVHSRCAVNKEGQVG